MVLVTVTDKRDIMHNIILYIYSPILLYTICILSSARSFREKTVTTVTLVKKLRNQAGNARLRLQLSAVTVIFICNLLMKLTEYTRDGQITDFYRKSEKKEENTMDVWMYGCIITGLL